MGRYKEEVTRSMKYLADDSRTVFLGQWFGVNKETLIDVPEDKKIEMPVAENMQMGISIGMALKGFIPVSCFIRWNFLLLAADQLVNHLDKLSEMSNGGYQPKLIIRTSVGAKKPVDSRCQHTSDFTEGFRKMLTNVEVLTLLEPEDVFPAYQKALHRLDGKSTLLVEYGESYNAADLSNELTAKEIDAGVRWMPGFPRGFHRISYPEK
jgi:pyruvate/2-oxoglutarate/acetoin dehydrogenase E1 component